MDYIDKITLMEMFSLHQWLSQIDRFYPEFSLWYINKLIPAVMQDRSRVLRVCDGSRLIGVGILRVSDTPKIQCLRVHPDYENKGVGYRIVSRLLTWSPGLPEVTVPEEKINDLSRLFVNGFGFSLTSVVRNEFRHAKNEYHFNGCTLTKTAY